MGLGGGGIICINLNTAIATTTNLAIAKQEMRARQNEEELIALENFIAEAQETMDLGIEDIN